MGKTKEELSEEINENFPLEEDIDWSKLSKEDLLQIKPLLAKPRQFVRQYFMEQGEDKVADMIVTAKQSLDKGEEEKKIGEGKIISNILGNL